MLFQVIAAEIEDGQWLLEVPSLQGCLTQADSLEDGIGLIKEAISLYLESQEPPVTVAIEDIALVVVRGEYVPSGDNRQNH